jgi:acyl-CoA thioesterase-1
MIVTVLACGNKADNSEKQAAETEEQALSSTNDEAKKTILCFGDSITAGYGLDDVNEAYPAQIQHIIDSLNLNYTVVNSGVSGETTSGGLSRIDWVLNQDVSIFLLELGANDGLRGIPLSETKSNLEAIINAVKQKNSETEIILAGMELPPNMGLEYTSEFRTLYADIAKDFNLKFIPFILENVGGFAELNQSDGIHPTPEGHKIVAANVWAVLGPLLYE